MRINKPINIRDFAKSYRSERLSSKAANQFRAGGRYEVGDEDRVCAHQSFIESALARGGCSLTNKIGTGERPIRSHAPDRV